MSETPYVPPMETFIVFGPSFPEDGWVVQAHNYAQGENGEIIFNVFFALPTGQVVTAPRYAINGSAWTMVEMVNPLFPEVEAGH